MDKQNQSRAGLYGRWFIFDEERGPVPNTTIDKVSDYWAVRCGHCFG